LLAAALRQNPRLSYVCRCMAAREATQPAISCIVLLSQRRNGNIR